LGPGRRTGAKGRNEHARGQQTAAQKAVAAPSAARLKK
jgi:hypothetical protein